MQVLNVGSVNIDHVYEVNHFVRPGETIGSAKYSTFAGGKGFNQSIALALAGASTRHAGKVGKDGDWLLQRLRAEGIDVESVGVSEGATGHAVIQVIPTGENAIVLHGGANQLVRAADIREVIATGAPGDYLLAQNETSAVAEALHAGSGQGMTVVFNPAPMTPEVLDYPLDRVDLFIVNETEAELLAGGSGPEEFGGAMRDRFPRAAAVVTLGSRGAYYVGAEGACRQSSAAVSAVDTTAAGDTFVGYFVSARMRGDSAAEALAIGCRAAGICVTRPGAADSIPHQSEV